MADVLSYVSKSGQTSVPVQVTDLSRLGPHIEKLADDVRQHAQLALAGDLQFFHAVEKLRAEKGNALLLDMKLSRVRREEEKAWKERGYQNVVDLYGSIEKWLSQTEKHKLEFAKKRLGRIAPKRVPQT
jgi:hypothetical protein